MDDQVFKVLASLFGLLVTVIGALVMLWVQSLQATLKSQKADADALRTSLTALALDVAANHMPRGEVEKKLDSIFTLLEEIRKEVRHA